MAGFALTAVVLIVLCNARFSCSSFDPATHVAVTTSTTNATGTESKLAGLDVYVTGSLDSSAAVVMISDVFGWKAPLFRKLGDKIASNGYYVVAPDFFHNDPVVTIPANITGDPWYIKHAPALSVEPAKEVVLAVKAKGFSSVGFAGFCWGSKVAILTVDANPHLVNAIVQLHPAFAAVSDYTPVVTPLMTLASPEDGIQNFTITSALEARKQEHIKVFFKVFHNVVHGWTIRYNESDPKEVYRAYRAHGLLLKWFHKYLHM